jgi:exopolyphosphatase/guanosine-5'-triphosphate,3'-diphosphate pyrophosphatase
VCADLLRPTVARRRKLAAVDVGTNTIRMIVAVVDDAHNLAVVDSGREMARLGQGLVHTGRLSEAAMARASVTLARFARAIREHAPDGLTAVATSAVREASNGPEFVARIQAETGLEVAVIDGEEEARLTCLGASAALAGPAGDLLVVDIGGGSTEFVLVQGGRTTARVSVGMGVVTLTEQFLDGDPPKPPELYELDECLRERMRQVREGLGEVGAVRLVATAGTPTTLAAVDLEMAQYDPSRINNHALTLARVEELYDRLVNLPAALRREVTGVEPGREELIVAGCAILLRVMHDYQFGSVTVCDWGLREGMLIDLFDRMGN